MRNGLKGCPYCGTPVEAARLGMRDFRWLEGRLPGRVGPSDIDFVLQQESTNRALLLELKAAGDPLPPGQRILLRHFVRRGDEARTIHVQDLHTPWQEVGSVIVADLDRAGNELNHRELTVAELADECGDWWIGS